MPIETLIDDYNKEKQVIIGAMKRQSEIIEKIKSAGTEDYDWISVKEAAQLVHMSEPKIYARANSGKLSTKYWDSKMFVRKSEVMAVNDGIDAV